MMATVVVAATVGYLRGAAQLRDRGDEWPRWHSGEFADGTFVLAAALVARPPEGSFATSTAQHVVVAMVASLLVLARPVTLTLRVASAGIRRRMLAVAQ